MRVCCPYETKYSSFDQFGQLDLQICRDSQLVHWVFHEKCIRGEKFLDLIVMTIYSAVRFIFYIYYNIFNQLQLIYIIAHSVIPY